LDLAPAAAAAGAAAAEGGATAMGIRIVDAATKETPVFFIERSADDRLVQIDPEHPETATWAFPTNPPTKFYDFLMANKRDLGGMGNNAGRGAFGRVRKINVGGTDYILKIIHSNFVQSAVDEISTLRTIDGSPYVLNMIAGIVFFESFLYSFTLHPWYAVKLLVGSASIKSRSDAHLQ
jgi:hypothetical protein